MEITYLCAHERIQRYRKTHPGLLLFKFADLFLCLFCIEPDNGLVSFCICHKKRYNCNYDANIPSICGS